MKNIILMLLMLLVISACNNSSVSQRSETDGKLNKGTSKNLESKMVEVNKDEEIVNDNIEDYEIEDEILHEKTVAAEPNLILNKENKISDNSLDKKVIINSSKRVLNTDLGVALKTPVPVHKIQEEVQRNFDTEDYDVINENEFVKVKDNALSTFSIDVDAASYANVRRMINYNRKPNIDAVRIEEMINYFNYNYPQPENEDPFNVITELSSCPWNNDHQLFHIGLQGKSMDVNSLPNSNLVFLIDVSGSMNSANKLPLLKRSFGLLTEKLRQGDKVAIVVYAGSSGLVLPSTNGLEKNKILKALNKLSSGGSTAGAAGIKLAYKVAAENYIKGGNNRVILATDGDFNVGESSDGSLVRLIESKRKEGVFLSILGFGMGNYKDNKMQKLSNAGNGNHYYIDGIAEAKKVLVNEFGGTLFTIAKDVKLQLEFNPNKVAAYRLIGYENRMLKKEDFNNDKKDAGELGSGHTVTALYEIIPTNIKSKFLSELDELKYQKPKRSSSKYHNELLTVKLRYKKPDEDQSKKIEIAVKENLLSLSQTSEAYKFSAAVAQFGLLLRDSKFKENSNFNNVLTLANDSKGQDTYGYRKEFISLVKKVQGM